MEGGCVTAGRAGVAALGQYAPRYGVELGEPSGPDWLRVDRILEPDSPELTELLKRDNDAADDDRCRQQFDAAARPSPHWILLVPQRS